jgi:ketosteroid isomerase-like protein
MSEENVEVVRQHVEAFRAGDAERAVSFLDPDIVMDARRYAAEAETIVGLANLDRFASRFKGAFASYDFDMSDFRDLGGGTILAVGRERGRGRTSGVPVERSMAGLYSVIDGKIVRITMFESETEALEAVGLSE